MKEFIYVSPLCEVVSVLFENAFLQGSPSSGDAIAASFDDEETILW